MHKEIIVGIDLGTTYSAIACLNQQGIPEIIANEEAERITPSVVLFEGSEIIVGSIAKQNAIAEPTKVVEFVKRQMGKPKEEWYFEHNGYEYSASEISSLILKKLKKDAEDKLGVTIKNAVITVPAYFNDSQREATIKSGKLAGLNVLRIVNEPTAAALTYGIHKAESKQNVLVFDLGGGTFDVTVMKIDGNYLQMLATNGDHMLGGKDWDDEIIRYVSEQFQTRYGLDPLDNLQAYQDIQSRAVQAKIAISSKPKTNIVCNHAGKSLNVELSRETFEKITTPLVDRCKTLVEIVLDEAKFKPSEIDTVLLAGGSTRMPIIKEMLGKFFGKEVNSSINPDECVAIGAAIQGALLGLERGLISKAAEKYLGGIKSTDVNSHSLGIVTLKNGKLHNSIIIPKNHPIPCEKSKSDYVTSYNNQTSLDIYLIQGEDVEPHNCTLLGAYEFCDIPPRPAGKSKLEVTFKYNLNGMVEVEAKDVLSSKVLPKKIKKDADLNNIKETAKPQDIALLIDCSGSMSGILEDAKKAAYSFLDRVGHQTKIGVISFGDFDAHIKMDLTYDIQNLKMAIGSLSASGGTPMESAISLADTVMLKNNGVQNIMILLTDGQPDDRNQTITIANKAKKRGVKIITIGIGSGVDSNFLKQVASVLDDYHYVDEGFELSETFINIATELSSQISR